MHLDLPLTAVFGTEGTDVIFHALLVCLGWRGLLIEAL